MGGPGTRHGTPKIRSGWSQLAAVEARRCTPLSATHSPVPSHLSLPHFLYARWKGNFREKIPRSVHRLQNRKGGGLLVRTVRPLHNGIRSFFVFSPPPVCPCHSASVNLSLSAGCGGGGGGGCGAGSPSPLASGASLCRIHPLGVSARREQQPSRRCARAPPPHAPTPRRARPPPRRSRGWCAIGAPPPPRAAPLPPLAVAVADESPPAHPPHPSLPPPHTATQRECKLCGGVPCTANAAPSPTQPAATRLPLASNAAPRGPASQQPPPPTKPRRPGRRRPRARAPRFFRRRPTPPPPCAAHTLRGG